MKKGERKRKDIKTVRCTHIAGEICKKGKSSITQEKIEKSFDHKILFSLSIGSFTMRAF